jgi:hypothetical protein
VARDGDCRGNLGHANGGPETPLVYVATGKYTEPQQPTSDAGWRSRSTPKDADQPGEPQDVFVVGCGPAAAPTARRTMVSTFDFGNPPCW